MQEIQESLNRPCRYIAKADLLAFVSKCVRPLDVVITLGAGDITHFSAQLMLALDQTPAAKYKVGLIYGGHLHEHAISLISAQLISASLNQEYYSSVHFGITTEGHWSTSEHLMEEIKNPSLSTPISVMAPHILQELASCDLIFPILHGKQGEDGILQGFLDILKKPYIGCNHRSAALCMDKALTKKLLAFHGIDTTPFIDFSFQEWQNGADFLVEQIARKLPLPLFIKPAHLGSSIGVAKVDKLEQLIPLIEEAFNYDDHLIVEKGLKMREIEFAVLGNQWVKTFAPGEVCTQGEFFSYAAKYGEQAITTTATALLSAELIEQGCQLAKTAYQLAGCKGMARVDFFLDEDNHFWLNEINPIPGFTLHSLFPKICEVNGLPHTELVDWLIVLALEEARRQKKLIG